MEELIIKSNELNAKTRELIKSVLKSDDWVDAFILLYEWLLKIDLSVVIHGYVGKKVGFYSNDMAQYLFYIVNTQHTGLQCRSSLPMKSLDFTFWDALRAVQESHYQDVEQPNDRMWNHDHYSPKEKQDKETVKKANSEKAAVPSSMGDSHSGKKVPLHDLINKQVIHKRYGQGKITSFQNQLVKVFFDGEIGEKVFVFPEAFRNYLNFVDPTLQQYVNELINK